MSLMVYIISKYQNIDTDELEKQIPSPHDFLFGFESYREKLWGNDIMKQLGCYMIYSLKDRDIYAFDEALQELKRELNVILNNMDIVANKATVDEYVEFRVKNALEVIKIAEKYRDVGVYIG